MNKFKKGDIVRVKGKGTIMIVENISNFGTYCKCSCDTKFGIKTHFIYHKDKLEMVGSGGESRLYEKVEKLWVIIKKKDKQVGELIRLCKIRDTEIEVKDRKIESIEEDRKKLGSMIDDKDETIREFAEDNKRLEKIKYTDSIINHMNNEKIEELEKEIKRLEEQI